MNPNIHIGMSKDHGPRRTTDTEGRTQMDIFGPGDPNQPPPHKSLPLSDAEKADDKNIQKELKAHNTHSDSVSPRGFSDGNN